MRRLLPVLAILTLAAEPTYVQQTAPAGARPNIVFIMSDDHAAHAISAYGSRINTTPNLDRLARDGMLMRNMFVTNSICTPSRAVILTGQYSHLNGVPVFNRFDSSRMTVARLLQQGGYHTGMVGKWHLGSDPVGFDYWEILPGQGAYNNPLLYTATGEKTYTGGYVTDVVTDLALDFLRARPREKPFFLMLHHKAVHSGFVPTDTYRKKFENRWIPEPDTLFDTWVTRTDALQENRQRISQRGAAARGGQAGARRGGGGPAAVADGAPAGRGPAPAAGRGRGAQGPEPANVDADVIRPAYQRFIRDYVATVQSIDDNVGRVLNFLDQEGLAQNTIVIYTSDQGFFLGDHGLFDKRFMYEESLRMPFLVRWPKQIPAGSKSDAIGLNVDLAQTFLDAAGLAAPSDMQGRSLLPVFRGKPPADWRTSMYYRYYHDPGHHNTRQHYGVRTMTHKLIYFWTKDQWELYDLVNDPRELHNLYGQPGHEAVTADLKKELARLKLAARDQDQFANQLPPDAGVDGSNPATLRGK
jgi:arylsulfatase A-like enzyme